jgi:hypothetical protein
MIVADHRLLNAVTAHSAAVLALVDDLLAGRGVQWEAPPGAVLHTEHDFRSDYARETAANPSRLKLRATVESGLLALEDATLAV